MKRRFVNFMLAAVILVFAAVFTGCFFVTEPPDDGSQTGTPSEGTQTPSGGSQTTGGSENTPQQDKKEGVVGDIIKTSDWDISLVYVKSLSEITGKYSAELPSEGKEFLVFFMECKNNQKHISTLYSANFDAYVDGLALTKSDIILNHPDDWENTSFGTHCDRRLRMTLIYEAPVEWEKAELAYKGNIFLSNVDAKFSVGFEDLAADDYKQQGSPFGEYAFDEQKITEFGTAVENRLWKIKLLNAREYTELNYSSAEKGKKFVAFFFEVENKSSESQHFNIYDFNFYCDGYSLLQELHLSNIEGYEDLSGDVISGAKREGFVLIEVDESYKNIEIFYDDISDSKACFAVSAEMLHTQENNED